MQRLFDKILKTEMTVADKKKYDILPEDMLIYLLVIDGEKIPVYFNDKETVFFMMWEGNKIEAEPFDFFPENYFYEYVIQNRK